MGGLPAGLDGAKAKHGMSVTLILFLLRHLDEDDASANLKPRVVGDMADHPIDRILAAGLRATINSDDPAYLGGYIADDYRAAAAGWSLGKDDLAMLPRKSFLGSFLPDAAVAAHLAALDAFVAEYGRCPS